MQYDSMLGIKQLELSRHLKELSQDDKAVQEMETKFDQKLVEQEEECCVANLKLTAEKLVKEQASADLVQNAEFRVKQKEDEKPRLTRHHSAGKSLFGKLVGQGSPFRPGYKSPEDNARDFISSGRGESARTHISRLQ